MWACLRGYLCVDFEDIDACFGHAAPVSENLSSGGPAPGAPVAQLRRVTRDLDDLAESNKPALADTPIDAASRTLRES